MIKFGASTKDLYSRKKLRDKTSSSQIELESPKTISLDDLRAMIPAATSKSSLSSPSISIGKLEDLLPRPVSLESAPEIDISDLLELLEPAGAISRDVVELRTKNLLNPDISEESPKFRAWKVVDSPSSPTPKLDKSRGARSLDLASEKQKESHNKFKKTQSVESVPTIKVKIVPKEADVEKVNGPEGLLSKLQELSEGDNLEKWIAELNLSKELDLTQIREQIHTFLKGKSWEKQGGLKFGIMDGSLAKTLWTWFKDLSIAKQIVVVIGLTLVVTAIGFLTAYLFSLIWPGLLGVATSGEEALVEIGVDGFKNRQEAAFQLLNFHAEHAKPMSYAWANQYILWKYCRSN